MMKILLIVLMGTSMSLIAEQTNSTVYYQALVQNIETQARKSRIKDEVGFIDAYFFLQRKEPYISFQKKMGTSSKFILAHFNEIASTEYQKAIVVLSTGKMTRIRFIEFLNALADLVEAGTLDRKFFKWAQSPTEGHLSGLLIREYAEPDVQNIIMRSKKIFQDQPKLVEQYNRMLTGESCRKLEQFETTIKKERTSESHLSQEPTIQKSVEQNPPQAKVIEEFKNISTSSIHQTTAKSSKAVLVKKTQVEEQKYKFVLPIVIGIIVILVSAAFWNHRIKTRNG